MSRVMIYDIPVAHILMSDTLEGEQRIVFGVLEGNGFGGHDRCDAFEPSDVDGRVALDDRAHEFDSHPLLSADVIGQRVLVDLRGQPYVKYNTSLHCLTIRALNRADVLASIQCLMDDTDMQFASDSVH